MLRYLLLITLIAFTACADDASSPDDYATDTTPDRSLLEAKARTALDAQERAIREADMAALDTLWATDPDVLIFEQGGVDLSLIHI